jgi:Flp pilus assembly protein TadD
MGLRFSSQLRAAGATLLIAFLAGAMPPADATAHPRMLASMTEETLPAEDLATPTATAMPQQAQASPEMQPTPEAGASAPTEPGATPSTSEAPALELGAVQPKGRISDSSLKADITHASSPALAASLRVTDQAREQMIKGRIDDAIHTLGRAISIDPTNPYAYLYLGRAYLVRKNYEQAITFLKRAELRFASNPDWLGETLSFEGLAYEQSGNAAEASAAYQKAVEAEPGNLMARVALTRLGPPQSPTPQPGSEQTPGPNSDWQVAPPPEAPPPGPPQSQPPPPPN